MVFSSYEFVFLFLPIVILIYFSLSKLNNIVFQHLFLVVASLFFYGYFNISYLFIIIASIIVNYILAKVMTIYRAKHLSAAKNSSILSLLLIIGILFNIGMLGYFKYYDFFIININDVFKTSFVIKNILLPLGISFFTFQQFSFIISIYKDEERLEGFIDYCLFVSFFPQLVAGPIVLYKEMMPQFADKSRRYLDYDNISKGMYMFTLGLFKKVVIADTVALFANNGFSMSNLSFSAAWITSLSYTLQIYFDFSGYSDMAIGLGKMFNIDIPVNFLSPYKSESITEFWRKWHITLGKALSTYIYIPLGGNRKGKIRVCFNLFITFVASGLWHGAAWTFIVWGVLHGIIVVFEKLFKNILEMVPKFIKIAATFITLNLLWILFRASSFKEALNIYKGLINIKNIGFPSISLLAEDGLIKFPETISIMFIIVSISMLYIMIFCSDNSIQKYKTFLPNTKNMVVVVLLSCISIIHLSRESIFIYFNF